MTTTETTPAGETPPAEPPATPPDPTETVEHWKDMARKQELRAKENAQAAKDLAKLKAETMSETEKAVAQAKAEGLTEGIRTGSVKTAQAEIRAAAAGRPVDVDALLEGVDATRFIDESGEVDRAQIVAWVDKVAPAGEQTAPVLDLGQGNRGGHGPGDPAQEFAKFLDVQLKR